MTNHISVPKYHLEFHRANHGTMEKAPTISDDSCHKVAQSGAIGNRERKKPKTTVSYFHTPRKPDKNQPQKSAASANEMNPSSDSCTSSHGIEFDKLLLACGTGGG